MFGAGDLESPTPYGLTQSEKVLVKTKKKLQKTDTKLQDIEQRVDGLESVLDSESGKLNKLFINFKKLSKDYQLYKQNSTEDINKNSEFVANMQISYDQKFQQLQVDIEQNKQNIERLKSSFDQIANLVNEINSKYVTKKEFNKLIAILDKKAKSKAKKIKKFKKSKKSMMAEARKLFKKDYFTKAKPIFEDLVAKNYRPAESNYYLGEISYYRKDYKQALYHFKLSMTLYDKAKYLPKLLLHSAISFEKLGDNENAQNFYNTIVDIYPDSIEAKEASKKIK